jgi:hypothetical protein
MVEFTLQNQSPFPNAPTIGLLKELVVLERDLRQKEGYQLSISPFLHIFSRPPAVIAGGTVRELDVLSYC